MLKVPSRGIASFLREEIFERGVKKSISDWADLVFPTDQPIVAKIKIASVISYLNSRGYYTVTLQAGKDKGKIVTVTSSVEAFQLAHQLNINRFIHVTNKLIKVAELGIEKFPSLRSEVTLSLNVLVSEQKYLNQINDPS